MTLYKTLGLLATLLVLCYAVEENIQGNVDVVQLTRDTVEEVLEGHRLTMVLVTAPWCAQCETLARVHAEAARLVAEDGDAEVVFATVDVAAEAQVLSELGAADATTPALLLVTRERAHTEYVGAHEPAALAAYVRARAGTVVHTLRTPAALARFLARRADARFVAYTASDSALAQAFATAAKECHDGAFLFAIATPEATTTADDEDKNEEKVIAYREYVGEEREVRLEGEKLTNATEKTLGEWFWDAGTPLAGVLDAETQGRYQTRPTLVVFARVDAAHDAAGTRYVLNRVRAAARAYAGRLRFAAQDRATSEAYYHLRFAPERAYAFAVRAGADWHAAGVADTLQPATLRAAADAFLAGALPRYVLSDAPPAALRAREVHVVVAHTFDALVRDTATDTFLAVVSPSCPHCRALAPAWRALARTHNVPNSTVRVARIDGTSNELPEAYRVPGFPTLFWVPAHRGARPRRYDGPRDLAALARFVATHASRASQPYPVAPAPVPLSPVLAVTTAFFASVFVLLFCSCCLCCFRVKNNENKKEEENKKNKKTTKTH